MERYLEAFVNPFFSYGNEKKEYSINTREEIDALVNIYKKVKRIKTINFISAINRLNFSYDRTSSEDILIDIIFSLESIYGKGINQGINYRLPNRIAFHLGKNKDDREEIHSFVKNAYSIRSDLAHGRVNLIIDSKTLRTKFDGDSIKLISKLIDLLRLSLKCMLIETREDRYKNDQFFPMMETSIIRGDGFQNFLNRFDKRFMTTSSN